MHVIIIYTPFDSLLLDIYFMDAGVFKPGACGLRPCVPGFLKLLWFVRWYVCACMCVSVCVSAPEAINNQWRDMV